MYRLEDFAQPFDAIRLFEKELARFTGAKYCIATDSCTHAIELAFRVQSDYKKVKFTAYTYLSVLMTMHQLNIDYDLLDKKWNNEYQFEGTNIWDSARRLERNMYRKGMIQCCSFGRTKPLEIGMGGCILLDDGYLAQILHELRYDGRQLYTYDRWPDQKTFRVGYHYYMRPEEAIIGLNKLNKEDFTIQKDKFYNYPDCRNIQIV